MPNKPNPIDITVDTRTTALLVLDLNARCEDPKQPCHKLLEPVANFLPRAREAGMFIVYTVSYNHKGTAEERMPLAFKQQENEPVVFPDAFDKFYGGELDRLLKQREIKTTIVTGASSNQAVLYTATSAARPHGYDIIIPMDGIIARGAYEHEYTLHQFTVLSGAASKFRFTELDRITFNQ